MARPAVMYYSIDMKTTAFRLPENLVAALDAEATRRRMSRSDVVRERLQTYAAPAAPPAAPSFLDVAGDIVGSVGEDGLPVDLSARKKHYLKMWGYGKERDRR